MAAYLDEPAMAHFARELDEAAVRTALADQGDGPLDVRVIECAVAKGYGGDAAAAGRRDGVDRRDAPPGDPDGPSAAPASRARPAASGAGTRRAGWCADGFDGDPSGRDHPPRPLELADDARQRALRRAPPGVEPARASAAELPARMNG